VSADRIDVRTLDELDAFLNVVGGFHDGIIKEVHWVNNDHICEDLSMLPYQRARVRMLVQRQRKNPSAVELVFEDVWRMRLDTLSFIFDSDLAAEEPPKGFGADGLPLLVLKMESSEVVFAQMRWRDASEWMGTELRFAPAME